MEMAFRPRPEHEVWMGAPQLVIEVLSPSNTVDDARCGHDTLWRRGGDCDFIAGRGSGSWRDFWTKETVLAGSMLSCVYKVETPEAAMKTTVKKWGNSAAVRIPASVMEAMRIDLDEVVEIREEKGRIVIEPLRQKTYVLDELLKGITAKNLHETVDFGHPQGKEVW
jgi:antitoxin MazE